MVPISRCLLFFFSSFFFGTPSRIIALSFFHLWFQCILHVRRSVYYSNAPSSKLLTSSELFLLHRRRNLGGSIWPNAKLGAGAASRAVRPMDGSICIECSFERRSFFESTFIHALTFFSIPFRRSFIRSLFVIFLPPNIRAIN